MIRAATAAAIVFGVASSMAAGKDSLPEGATFIIQLTGSQYASGLGQYLLPPLSKAFAKTSLRYEGGPGADYAATVEHTYDVGSWHDVKGGKVWLYDTAVTVGLTPAAVDAEPGGKLSPAFSVSARLLTEDADRVDELNCLIALAVGELALRYRRTGHVTVNGARCGRTE